MSRRYRSDAMAAIHETMEALHRGGAVDKQTMRPFGETCLTPVQSLTPKQIKTLRGAGARQPDGLCKLPQRDTEPCE